MGLGGSGRAPVYRDPLVGQTRTTKEAGAIEARARTAAKRCALRLGWHFADLGLLARALVHPSVSGEVTLNNERLEFLGDRVLGLIIAGRLHEQHENEPEGLLARRFIELVRRETLAEVARAIGLGADLVLGRSEEENGGRDKPATLANAFEAVLAAFYLDGGLVAADSFVAEAFAERLMVSAPPPRDPKTALQEWSQAKQGALPVYRTLAVSGEAHQPCFEVEAEIAGFGRARASGTSKRDAEREAAAALLAQIARNTAHD